MAMRTPPSERKDPVNDAAQFGFGAIADGCEIGNQPDIPKEQRNCAVDGDGEDVPDEGATEVGPDRHLVGQRQHPVSGPNPAYMDTGKDQGAHDGKDRHRFCRTIDGRSPFLAKKEQDRRDERTSMADTNPKDEIDDRPSPSDGIIDTPDPDPFPDEVEDRDTKYGQKRR